MQDKKLSVHTLTKITQHLATLHELLTFTVLSVDRQSLARLISDTAALAGWQALDAGQINQAMINYNQVRIPGFQAHDIAVLAHALGEQAFALVDTDRVNLAHTVLEEALSFPSVPPIVKAWLFATQGEIAAYMNDLETSCRYFDQAQSLLPTQYTHNEEYPYITLNSLHLERWRGHALTLLGETESIESLERILTSIGVKYPRASCGLHVDLATGYAPRDDREKYSQHNHQASKLARKITSRRNIVRLQKLHQKLIYEYSWLERKSS